MHCRLHVTQAWSRQWNRGRTKVCTELPGKALLYFNNKTLNIFLGETFLMVTPLNFSSTLVSKGSFQTYEYCFSFRLWGRSAHTHTYALLPWSLSVPDRPQYLRRRSGLCVCLSITAAMNRVLLTAERERNRAKWSYNNKTLGSPAGQHGVRVQEM